MFVLCGWKTAPLYCWMRCSGITRPILRWSNWSCESVWESCHLVCSCQYHYHFESNVGLSAFGSQEPEPVPEACLKVLLIFHYSFLGIFAVHGTPNEHEHGWELIRAGSYVREHAVVECMKLVLACHVPHRHSNPLSFDGCDLDSSCSTLYGKQGPDKLISLTCAIHGTHGGYKGGLPCTNQIMQCKC